MKCLNTCELPLPPLQWRLRRRPCWPAPGSGSGHFPRWRSSASARGWRPSRRCCAGSNPCRGPPRSSSHPCFRWRRSPPRAGPRYCPSGARAAVAGTAAGALPILAIVAGTGLADMGAQAVIVDSGLVTCGCMSASTRMLRHHLVNVRAQRGAFEGVSHPVPAPGPDPDPDPDPRLNQVNGACHAARGHSLAFFGGASALVATQFQLVALARLAVGGAAALLATPRRRRPAPPADGQAPS